jgi:hypothetical protein
MTPALLTRMCSGWSQAAAKRRTESWSARSRAHRDLGVPGGASDAGRDLPGCLRAPHGQNNLRAGRGQGVCGFDADADADADAGAGPGHDGPLAGQVDPVDHLRGGGVAAERGLEKL